MVDRGTVRENMSAGVNDTSSLLLDQGNVSAVLGSLAAGNGHMCRIATLPSTSHQDNLNLTPDRITNRYEVFQDDLPGDLRQLQIGRQDGRW